MEMTVGVSTLINAARKSGRWACAAAMVVFCGCLSNGYEQFYIEMSGVAGPAHERPVEIRTKISDDDIAVLTGEGYALVGTSSFSGLYNPMYLAVDSARKHGADLVLLDISFEKTVTYNTRRLVPIITTSYTYGNYSSSFGSGTFSSTTTGSSLAAVPTQRMYDRYLHYAYFFRKVDTSGWYGVVLDVPRRLPTEKTGDPIMVKVFAVIQGSRAEKDGIRRGQTVKSINGAIVTTRGDVASYDGNPAAIKAVEVYDEN